MTLPAIIGPDAEREIEEIVRRYELRREELGERFLSQLDLSIAQVEEQPLSGALVPHVPPEFRVRRVLLERFPYFVAYLVLPDAIHVLAMGHQHRRPGYYLWRVRRLL
ncbi:MAG: type II toxin-antitoxin system RelE/ParE family toxin [Thermoanaerobaculia bacterium]|nr:type II toxin-antitoxin system RelE/ParE family toxin [Thermoanaerobaculia bacterium]